MTTEKLKRKALLDIWAFADLIDFRGGSKSFYSLHKEMTEVNCANQLSEIPLRENRRRLFLVPREHRKSTVNTILYTLWRVYRNPDIRVIVCSNVKDLALDFIREMRQYLEDEDLIHDVWNKRPHRDGPLIPRLTNASSNYKRAYTEADDSKVIWTSWALQVVRDLKDKQPTIQALSVGMRPTGKHADLIIFDDIVDWENSRTPEKAEKVKKWARDIESVVTKKPFRQEIAPGINEWVGNEILINGTRYYSHDFYSHYVGNDEEEQKARLEKTKYTAFIRDVYVNGKNNSDGYICPEIFDAEVERDLLDSESITMSEFQCQYRNKIMSESDIVLMKEDVRIIFPDDYRTTSAGMVNFFDRREIKDSGPKVYPLHLWMIVDLAGSKKSSDDSVVGVGGIDEDYRLHLVYMKHGKWQPVQLYQQIDEAREKFRLSLVNYEGGVGYQDSFDPNFRYWLKVNKKQPMSVQRFVPPRSISKEDRIKQTLQPFFENQRVCIHTDVWRNTPLAKQIVQFNPNSTSNYDDCLEVLEIIARTAKPMRAREERQDPNFGRNIRLNTLYGGVR